jgi:phosphoribosylanthranilate isomerase
VLIKICGIARPEDAEAAVTAGAHLAGFVFVPGTPRALEPDAAHWIRDVPVATVGVFRDATLDEVRRVRDLLRLDWVQLHGREPDDWIHILGGRVIRRIGVSTPFRWDPLVELARRCLPLIDPGAGDGRAFDWGRLGGRPPGTRFGLAGGLTPDTVADAIRTVRPDMVDVSSGVEASPGIKDHAKVRSFVRAAREAW